MFPECLNSKSKAVSALGILFQTAAEVCGKDRSAKAEWARFTTSRFWFSDLRFLDGVYTAEQTDTGIGWSVKLQQVEGDSGYFESNTVTKW